VLTNEVFAVNSYIKYTHFRKMQADFSKKSKKNQKRRGKCEKKTDFRLTIRLFRDIFRKRTQRKK
jgi:hypothetical protein